jgi:hypothetical protein
VRPQIFVLFASAWLSAALAPATLVSIEPDDFTAGSDISQAVPGATLARVGSEFPGTAVFASLPDEPSWAATGALVFGHAGDDFGDYDEHWVLDTSPAFSSARCASISPRRQATWTSP